MLQGIIRDIKDFGLYSKEGNEDCGEWDDQCKYLSSLSQYGIKIDAEWIEIPN